MAAGDHERRVGGALPGAVLDADPGLAAIMAIIGPRPRKATHSRRTTDVIGDMAVVSSVDGMRPVLRLRARHRANRRRHAVVRRGRASWWSARHPGEDRWASREVSR
ncbi:hypothetical protein GCM10027187_06230 [Streptosporangium sandarakinum]